MQTFAKNIPRRSPRFRMPGGFTLIELLTVIAIIGILAAIIIPTVGKVRQTARRVNDAANLRSIWTAATLFSEEHRDFLLPCNLPRAQDAERLGYPTGTFWYKILRPYLGYADTTPYANMKIIQSPARSEPLRSYSPNVYTQEFTYQQAGRGLRIRSDVTAPSRFMYFGDHEAEVAGGRNTNYLNPVNTDSMAAIPRDWFDGKAQFVFLDGHVELIPVDDVQVGGARHSMFTDGL
ncbi:hypothetical protein OPIT5_14040 [Opitutaceae bacterium TAV5]|nr:hypothetical protein OPIT5_14040 [Opitutaceae bacterium TAV5]